MTILTVFDFGSQDIRFEQRKGQVWVCLTDMAKATGCKNILSFARTKRGKEYIQTLLKTENCQLGDVYTKSKNGTWAETMIVLPIIQDVRPIKLSFELKEWFYNINGFTSEQVDNHVMSQINKYGGFNAILQKLNNEYKDREYNEFVWEKEYSDLLAKEYSGCREVPVPNGFIDVLTETEIIEVKEKSKWLNAVEQVNRYHIYFPMKTKCIFLFNKSAKYTDNYISNYCERLNIRVMFSL